MNAELWHTFTTVAEVGTISGAARQLNLSQSAVSQKIQQLEREYGCALFLRTAHGVMLTPAGEVLYRYAHKILRIIDQSRQALAADPRGQRLAIGASLTVAEYVLPDVLGRWYRGSAQPELSVVMANSRTIFDQVLHGTVDVGLIEAELGSPQVLTRRFADDHLVVVTSARHPWASRRTVRLPEFLAEPLIIREPGSGTRGVLESALAQVGLGVEDLTVRLVLGTTQAIKAMVAQGVGVSVLSARAILPEERGRYHLAEVEGLRFTRSFYAVLRRDRQVPAALALIDRLVAYGRSAVGTGPAAAVDAPADA
ncbi:MAG: LysR family transcriptional regulator [Actinomycetia bacterium]|nr:LysR family transcriptional regulator [Actinomycetes bacterium]